MAKTKPKNFYPIKDLAAANAALAEIASLKRSTADIETNMNDEIDKIKIGSEAKAAPLQTRLMALENGLLAYAEFNKDELFKNKRSKELDFGSLGYRKSREVKPKPKHTWKMILGTLKEMKFKAAIRTKESINKDELHQWPDERLELIGARRVKKDTFWYEIDEQKIAAKEPGMRI